MRSYSIGEISKMFNLPISTLRYYDKEGLFPDLQRYGDRRLFTDYEIEALHVIECLKASGLGKSENATFRRQKKSSRGRNRAAPENAGSSEVQMLVLQKSHGGWQ